MPVTSYTCTRAWKRPGTQLITLLTIFLFIGCSGANYGKLDRDRDLDNMFLKYEVLTDHRYYISGGYAAPNAIMAIHRDYELYNPGDLWVPVANVDSLQMRKWIDTIAPEQNYRYANAYFAAYILDPQGERIGAWYSYENFATIKFLDGNRIQVTPPDLFPNIQLQRGRSRRGP
ncbi:MAG: hypothetical protein R3297_00815 [Desulfobulbales bacterium]|nr:hypothetical protein [Desulfobulbales bacterium]